MSTDTGTQTPSPKQAHFDLQMSWLPERWLVVRHISAQVNKNVSLAWSNTGNLLAYLWYGSETSVTVGVMNTSGQELSTRSLAIKPGDTLTFAGDLLDDKYIALMIHHIDTTQSLAFLETPYLIPVYTTETVSDFASCGYFDEIKQCVIWNYATHQIALRVKTNIDSKLLIVTPAAKRTQTFPSNSERTVLEWSPDGAFLAIVTGTSTQTHFELAVLRVSDSTYTVIARNLSGFGSGFGYKASFAVWSVDSQTLSFGVVDAQDSAVSGVNGNTIPIWNLTVWHPTNQQNEYPTRMVDAPNFSADRTHALVVDVSDDQHWYRSLLDVRTGKIQPLANENRPGTVGFWERGGKLLWIEANDPAGVHFTWANADGLNKHQIVIPGEFFLAVMIPIGPEAEDAGNQICHANLEALPDGSPYRLLYTGSDETHVNVWLLDLRTQALHKLSSAEGLINTYLSPDVKFIALGQSDDCSAEEARANPSTLVLASIDGSTLYKVALPTTLHSAAWSPDGTMLIYNVYNSTSMQIISRNGTVIRQYDDVPFTELNHSWTTCKSALKNQ